MARKIILLNITLICFAFLTFCNQNLPPEEFNQKVTVRKDAQAGTVLRDSLYDIELVCIPSGTIKFDADYERHEMIVFLKSFYIGKYEITQSQWKAVMGDNPSEVKGDNLPVTNINWFEAEEFVKELSKDTGRFYRLPTEFEWEYAYRAGTDTDFYFGNDTLMLSDYEWYDKNSGKAINPVGLKKPNPWGLYDMGGNVCEWVSDLWDPAPYLRKNPDRGPFNDNLRIVRGSSFMHRRLLQFGSSWVHAYEENRSRAYTGLRIVRGEK
ncbi:formylglycine-generating enzyme family protein [Bacteroidota bacterium]